MPQLGNTTDCEAPVSPMLASSDNQSNPGAVKLNPKYDRSIKYFRDPSVDIYSYGIILWELDSGQVPFADEPEGSIFSLLSQRNLRMLSLIDKWLYSQHRPFVWTGDFNNLPEDVAAAGVLNGSNSVVCPPTAPTLRFTDRVIDYFMPLTCLCSLTHTTSASVAWRSAGPHDPTP